MKRTRIKLPSAPLAVSFVALFISLTATALALQNNSVRSNHIVNDAIRSVDLQDDGAVASVDVIDDAITRTDVAPDTLGSTELAPSSVGGSELASSSVGSAEIASNAVGSTEIASFAVEAAEIGDGVVDREGTTVEINPGDLHNGDWGTGVSTASCQSGEELLAGHGLWLNNQPGDELAISEIDLNMATETVTAIGAADTFVSPTELQRFRAVAVCLQT